MKKERYVDSHGSILSDEDALFFSNRGYDLWGKPFAIDDSDVIKEIYKETFESPRPMLATAALVGLA